MHTLLHHVKRALFFFSFFVPFRRIVPTTTWMGGKNRGLPRKQTVASILSQVTNKCFVGFFFDSYPYYLDLYFSFTIYHHRHYRHHHHPSCDEL